MTNHDSSFRERDAGAEKYEPENVALPPLYVRPFRVLPALRYLLFDVLFPLGFIYIAMAVPIWSYLTPSLETMSVFEPGWIGTSNNHRQQIESTRGLCAWLPQL